MGNSLLSKILPGKAQAPTCPLCGSSERITKLRTVDVKGDPVDVYSCVDPSSPDALDPWNKRKASCRVTSFALLTDGSRVVGTDGLVELRGKDPKTEIAWVKRVMPTADQMVNAAVSAVRVRYVLPKRVLRFCHNRPCASFGLETSKPFCGRCGSGTQDKGTGIHFPDGLRLAICSNEACTEKGKRREVPKLNSFCEHCGTNLGVDMDKTADVVAAMGGGR